MGKRREVGFDEEFFVVMTAVMSRVGTTQRSIELDGDSLLLLFTFKSLLLLILNLRCAYVGLSD